METADLRKITSVFLPDRDQFLGNNQNLDVRSRISKSRQVPATIDPFAGRGGRCRRATAVLEDGKSLILEFASFKDDYDDVDGVIKGVAEIDGETLDLRRCVFRDERATDQEISEARDAAREAWRLKGISYHHEVADEAGNIQRSGLRLPQTGALHSVAAYWTLNQDPALIVMPTGTGKTEVMIATSIAGACERVLVIVPTDALRSQTANKFATYGILEKIETIAGIPNPVIGILSSTPSPEHFDRLNLCNVVVSTMSSIGGAVPEFMARFAGLFSHVFFDEAHHIGAASWKRFRECCGEAKVLLFTATPFREDGKPIHGKIIYNYPLSAAQAEGYFKPIRFREVFQPIAAQADYDIAEEAVRALREDLEAGFDHALMARASKIDDATRLFEGIYRDRYPDLSPVLIHSRTPGRKNILDDIRAGRHRIVVCVDMFGEGFDLPRLKVAALHSTHKSLGITLQFIGRFARAGGNVGPATFVANTAEDNVPEALEALYAEDSDWNSLLSDLSHNAIDPQAQLQELVAGMRPAVPGASDLDVSLIALKPKIGANVYRVDGFRPQQFRQAFREAQTIHQPHIGDDGNLLVLIVNELERIDWTDSKDLLIDRWDLYIAFYDADRSLLFINTSKDGASAKRFADAVGVDPIAIQDEDVFRAFSSMRRIVLHSVGLTSTNRNVRYQMFAGLDVRQAVDPTLQHSRRKSNIMGVGYSNGVRESVGCSRKGKIWSLWSGSLAAWKSWCLDLGAKLTDLTAPPNAFLTYTLIPKQLDTMPAEVALLADWPDQMFETANFRFELLSGGQKFDFHDCAVVLTDWGNPESFGFSIIGGGELQIDLRLHLKKNDEGETSFHVEREGDVDGEIFAFGKRRSVEQFFTDEPPLIRIADGSQVAGNIILEPNQKLQETYQREALQTLNWAGVDLKTESWWRQGIQRPNSIQQKFIEHLQTGEYTFIIDDDDTGESADIVAIEEGATTIVVHFWHCKYTDPVPGVRASDLYEVCGQAQKSVKWTWSLNTLITHLVDREATKRHGRPTRFAKGTIHDLATLRKSSRRKFVEFRVGIVQPGVQKNLIPVEHLAILGATNSFLQIVTGHPLTVFCS